MRPSFFGRTMTILLLVFSLAVVAGCKKQDTPPNPEPPADSGQTDPNDQNGNGNDNGGTTTPTITPPASSVKVGDVELNADEVAKLQAKVNAGEDLWRLEPLEVAKREAAKFGFSDSDTFHLISEKPAGDGSGTGEAIVQVVHDGSLYFVQLIQPNGPGDGSIWWINAVMRDAK